MNMLVEEIRQVLSVLEVNLDRNFQLLIDAVLSSAFMPSSMPLQVSPSPIIDQSSRLQESAETVQQETNVKNTLIMTLAEGASRRASEDSWQPLVEYFRHSSTSGEPVDIAAVQKLIQKIPSSNPIQIVVASNSGTADSPTSAAETTTVTPQIVIVKSSTVGNCCGSSFGSDNPPGISLLCSDADDFDRSSMVPLNGSLEEEMKSESKDKGNQTRQSWDTQELVSDSSSNGADQGMNGTYKKKEQEQESEEGEEEDETAHVENIAALRDGDAAAGNKPVSIEQLPSVDSNLSSSVSEDSAARRQQNAYVVQRIDQLQKHIAKTSESADLMEGVMKMAEQMQQASASIIQTLDALHHQLQSDNSDIGGKYLELVSELKRNVVSDVARGGRLLSSVSTSRALSSQQ